MPTGWGRRRRVEMQKTNVNQSASPETAWFAGLSTANPNDDGQSNAEPTSSNGYARQAITWNTLTVYTSITADQASNATNSAGISWTSSGGGFSTGATNLTHVSIWNASSLASTAETAYLGRAAIAVPQAVAASGITLTLAANTGLTMGCISA